MRKRALIACVAAFISLASCDSAQPPNTSGLPITTAPLNDETAIAIAVFERLIASDSSSGASRKYALILCMHESAPPTAVIDAVSRLHPRILACGVPTTHGAQGNVLQIGGDPRKTAIQYDLLSTSISGNQASVKASYFEAGLSSGGYSVVLQKKNGVWEITSFGMDWIS